VKRLILLTTLAASAAWATPEAPAPQCAPAAEIASPATPQAIAALLRCATLHQNDMAAAYRSEALTLIGRGVGSNQANSAGIRPLHLASAEPDGTITALLLAQGADPLQEDNQGRSALDHALAHAGNGATFALLLDTAAGDLDESQRELLIEAMIQTERVDLLDVLLKRFPMVELDPVDASQALALALWQGARLETAERFWRAGADAPLLHSQGQVDLAWRLATLGHLAELDWLLADGYPLNSVPDSGFPPLFFANPDATRALLQRGADPNLPSLNHGTLAAAYLTPPAPFDEGGVALDAARLALLLEQGLNPNLRDPQGFTALERALADNQLWLVQALLNAGANPALTSDGSPSLLPQALATRRLPVVQAVIRSLPDLHDRHPLLLLEYVGNDAPDSDIVEALLVAGLSADLTGAEGESALLRAARLQHWPLVTLLLRYGADPERSNAQGCSLHCYSWSMPASLQQQLQGPEPEWHWPQLDRHPSAFFALGLSPMLGLWLIAVGIALARRRSLWPGTLWMLASGTLTLVLVSALFYQCNPCLITATEPRQALTMTLAALLFLLGPWRRALFGAQPS
jgi:ankyrin repeat protein